MGAITIDYTAYDFDVLKNELIEYLRETQTFKDAEFQASNINTLVGLYAYLGSLFGYYTNSVANEVFLPSAKRYKNLNRICSLLAYYPRGDKAATVDAIGSLSAEYCLGKEDIGFEIPSYSIFPSIKKTPEGQNFAFTNPTLYPYIVKGFGIHSVEQSDFIYSGSQLPLTKPASFWGITEGTTGVGTTGTTGTTGTSGTPILFLASNIELVCSDTAPLSILDRLDPNNYRGYDTDNAPLFDPNNSNSIGQPFTRNINVNDPAFSLSINTIYYIIWNYNELEGAPFLSIIEEGEQLEERRDDIITSIILEPSSSIDGYYTLKEVQNNSKRRFYIGVLGASNLDSVSFEYDIIEGTSNSIKQIHLDINKSGDKPPLQILVDGAIYTFESGRISSQIFNRNNWDINAEYYNVNLSIVSPTKSQLNYNAELIVTADEPGTNQATIARIYPSYVDSSTSTSTIIRSTGNRFGDFQAVPSIELNTAEQKTGYVEVASGVEKVYVTFSDKFSDTTTTNPDDYVVSLTPSDNVQVWVSSKTEDGFIINVEPNSGFDGKVYWLATQFDTTLTREINVSFDEAIPQIDGEDVDYTIFLTPSDNVQVWASEKTSEGFKINVEKSFNGTVTWSTFVFDSTDENVISEQNAATLKRGTAILSDENKTKDIVFDVVFPDDSYGLHMIANKNVNVYYTNKTSSGFTINIEDSVEGQVTIDWFADYSTEYRYQKHGMVNFLGQVSSNGTLPGLRFVNIPETFKIRNLKQGNILFSFINSNGAINEENNFLNLKYTADRTSFQEIKLYCDQENISYSDIRVFVKNTAGDWEEWSEGSALISSTEIDVGSKVFFIRVNEYQKIEISFGDGESFGTNPYGNEIYIFGLETVGQYGNIPPNTLSESLTLSKQILGDDNITLQFEAQFIQLLGLKRKSSYVAANERTDPTALYDADGTRLTSEELTIKQPTSAIGGAFPETVEELRRNASTSNLRQNRLVSLGDYKGFIEQAFNDYIIKAEVLSYDELKESGFLPEDDIEQYWFNTIFVIALPRNTESLSKDVMDLITESLNSNITTMLTVEHKVFSATKVPIDVRVRYKPLSYSSRESIDASIRTIINNFFDENNHEMGEEIKHSDLLTDISVLTGIDYVEVAMHKDVGDVLKETDYDIDAVATSTKTVQDVKRAKILELLAKDPSLLTIVEPLFDVTNTETNERTWVFTLNINLNKFEFPILGDIIIEVVP